MTTPDLAALLKIAEAGELPRPVAEALVRGMQVLVTCGEKFREYEALHAAKPDPVKARRNAEMAEQCEAALSALTLALKGSNHGQ